MFALELSFGRSIMFNHIAIHAAWLVGTREVITKWAEMWTPRVPPTSYHKLHVIYVLNV